MATKDIQDYLDKGMYGAPQIKPDEVKKYLGTYRERVVFAMTFEETKPYLYDSFCLEQFKKYPDGALSIDANAALDIQNHYMKLAQQKNINFKMVDSDVEHLAPEDITIVFFVDHAIDLEDITVKRTKKEKTSPTVNKEEPKKESFFKRLFKS